MQTPSMPSNPDANSTSPREIFLSALDCSSSSERAALLDEVCGDDAQLREEVETLLKESNNLDGFLDAPAMENARDTTMNTGGKPDDTSAPDIRTGDKIGPYKLLQKIGEGGCGSVYMADQEKPVRRRVALKIIKLGMDTRSVIARFESERQALAMMEHENIARVLDAGSTDAGRPYFVMELVRGISITDYCDKENLTAKERLTLFVQVCHAIQHAHQKGIIHRDIKPTNILVTMHDGVPVPKIIDFGIAKATEQRLTDKTLFTEYQAFIGTPTYMSPEQAEMSGLDIDTRSDIYALGVLLYELLIGKTPFDAEALRTVGLDECRRTIRESEPDRPSVRLGTMLDADQSEIAQNRQSDTAQLGQLLRGDLDWIVMKCLEKDRRRRYATVNDLIQDIQRHINGELVLARPPSTLYRLTKLARRHRRAFAAAAGLVLSLIAGITVSTLQMLRAQKAERVAQVAEENQAKLLATAEERRSQALKSERAAQLSAYVADVNLTHHALNEGNFGRALQLIQQHRPPPEDTDRDFRGFEWRYLVGMCQGDAHADFPFQDSAVLSISVSPDGEVVAAGTREQVQIWDVRSRSLITTLPTGAHTVAFLKEGKMFVTASRNEVQIWNSTTFSKLTELPDQRGPIAITADGSKMVTANRQGVRIWNTGSWEAVKDIEDARSPLTLSPDGESIAARSEDGVKIWNATTGETVQTLANSDRLFGSFMPRGQTLVFSPDQRYVVAPRNTKSERGVFVISIWDAETGDEIGTMPSSPQLTRHTGVISGLAFSPDGTTLATGSWDHSIQLWDFTLRTHITTLRGQSNEVWSVAFSPDGQSIAGGGKDGSLKLWPARQPDATNTIPGHWQPLAINGDGKQLASVNREGTVGFFDLKSLKQTRSIALPNKDAKDSTYRHSRSSQAVAISADLKTLVQGLRDGSVAILDTESRERTSLSVSTSRPSFVALSPDAHYLVAGGRRQPLTVWDLHKSNSTEPIATIDGERALFSQTGETMIVFSERGKEVEVWDATSMTFRDKFVISPRPGYGVALTPDGGILATTANIGDFNNAVSLWDTSSGELLGECIGHKQGVWSIAFAPDGKSLASSSDDGTLKFWNVATQQEMLSIRQVGTTLTHLTFSPDGQWLVSSKDPFSTSGELQMLRAPSFGEIEMWLSPDKN